MENVTPPQSPTVDKGKSLPLLWLIFLLVSIAVISLFKTNEGDLFMHVRIGEYIVQTGTIPLHDVLSLTAPGEPWVNHEWLFGVLIYFVHSLFGYTGTGLLKVLMVVTAFALIWRFSVKAGAHPGFTAALAVCGAMAIRFRLFERPQMVTYVFFVLYLIVLQGKRPGYDKRLLWLPVMMVAWINLHAAAVLGVGITALDLLLEAATYYSLKAANRAVAPERKRGLVYEAGILGASAIASLLNPNGLKVWTYFFTLSPPDAKVEIREWAGALSPVKFPLLFGLLLLTGLIFIITLKQQKAFWGILYLSSIAAMSQHIRHSEFFVLIAIPAIGLPLTSRLALLKRSRKFMANSLSVCSLGLIAGFMYAGFFSPFQENPRFFMLGTGPNPHLMPVDILSFIETYKVSGRFFNDASIGGYLMQEWPDKPKVFFDGRMDVYRSVYGRVQHNPPLEIFNALQIDYAILDVSWGDNNMATYFLNDRRNWALVYYTDYLLLFVRRIPRHHFVITENEIFFYRPKFDFEQLPPERLELAINEHMRRAAKNPAISYNHAAISMLAMAKGNYELARTALDRFLQNAPYDSMPYILKAELESRLNQWTAVKQAVRAARLRRASRFAADVYYGKCHLATGRYGKAIKNFQRVVAANPYYFEIWDLLADSFQAAGNLAAANKVSEQKQVYLDELIDRDKQAQAQREQEWLKLNDDARTAMETNDRAAAETALRRALALIPEKTESYTNLANFYTTNGATSEAGAILQQGLKQNPQALELKVALGLVLLQTENPQTAEPYLRSYIESDQDLPAYPARATIQQLLQTAVPALTTPAAGPSDYAASNE